jgi:hypothetical protein
VNEARLSQLAGRRLIFYFWLSTRLPKSYGFPDTTEETGIPQPQVATAFRILPSLNRLAESMKMAKSAEMENNSIWNRKMDLLYLVFFCTHVPVMFGMLLSLFDLSLLCLGFVGRFWTEFGIVDSLPPWKQCLYNYPLYAP